LLKLVHEYLRNKWDETGLSLEKIRQNIINKNPQNSISVSKLHRIFSDPTYKLSLEEMMFITEALGQDPNELLAKIGGREYAASKPVDYKGATALIADFKRREDDIHKMYTVQLEKEAVIRENIRVAFTAAKEGFDHAVDVLQTQHEAALAKRDDTYDRTVGHLKTQLVDARDALGKAEEKFGAAIKSVKWWRFVAVLTSCALAVSFMYVIWELQNLDKGATAVLIQMVRDGLV